MVFHVAYHPPVSIFTPFAHSGGNYLSHDQLLRFRPAACKRNTCGGKVSPIPPYQRPRMMIFLFYGKEKCKCCIMENAQNTPQPSKPLKILPVFSLTFPKPPLPTKENTAHFRSTTGSTNRVKSPASPRLSLAFVQELCYTPRQGNPIKPVLFCAIGSRTISSAGMSIRLTCGRSQVQVLYRPPKSSLTIRELFLISYDFCFAGTLEEESQWHQLPNQLTGPPRGCGSCCSRG